MAGESADIVRLEQVGEVFESENSEQLVVGLLRMRNQSDMLANYKRNSLAAAKRYDRKDLAQIMLQILINLKEKNR